MELVLSVLRCPDSAAPEVRRVSGGEYRLGRGADCDWVLADPDRVLSKHHCVLEFRSGEWTLRDLSVNGTFLNNAAQPLGRDRAATLTDGDRLHLGPYEIDLRLEQAGAAPSGWGDEPDWDRGTAQPRHDEPMTRRLPGDPFTLPASGDPALPRGRALPTDFDPFAEDEATPDHVAATSNAFAPPKVINAAPELLDDWDLGPSSAPISQPSSPVGKLPSDWDHVSQPAAPHPVVPPATPPHTPQPSKRLVAPAQSPGMAPRGLGTQAASAAAPASVTGVDEGLAAFLEGAGLPERSAGGADPRTVLHALGAAFRASITGLRALLIARADVKREFRIEQTMIRSIGNNPMKFAATSDAAMAAIIAAGPEKGLRAVEDTVEDLTAHQVAVLAATQAAARALLQRLSPEELEAQEQGGGGGLFGARREKRLWDAYQRLHQQVTDQFDDDFDSAFGKEFARAYEEASKRGG